ncbi:hypothetical protein FHS68_000459 [Dyadobacter arcticus]|uniref:Uncharacterized protein n=1 Tax=Dyadobacter arcticus TaxID=1078754 RepID=A0ABX0UE75_9BACT|nr:hypothetical protein [Dyadobacter arcticus]
MVMCYILSDVQFNSKQLEFPRQNTMLLKIQSAKVQIAGYKNNHGKVIFKEIQQNEDY